MSVTMELLKGKKPSGSAAAKAVSDELGDTPNTKADEKSEAVVADPAPPAEPIDGAAVAKTLPKMKVAEVDELAEKLGVNGEDFDSLPIKDKKSKLLAILMPPIEGAAEEKAALPKAVKNITKVETVTTAEILGPDLISETVKRLENLTEDEALPFARELTETSEFSEFKLGGVLSKIQTEGWFGDHQNFKVMVQTEFGFGYRKAMYLVSIYHNLVEANVPWSKVSKVGWTKLKELAAVLNPGNVDEWVAKAQSMKFEDLKLYLKNMNKPSSEMVSKDIKTITTKTFKLHEDQKETVDAALEKAKESSNTDVDTVALEYICIEYLNQTSKAKPSPKAATAALTLEDQFTAILKKHGGSKGEALEEIFKAFDAVFPDVTIDVTLPEA